MWDIKIREVSNGKHNIGDFFQNLMIQTNSGNRKYTWTDIKAALQETADFDWENYYQSYIKGNKPLPLDAFLPLVALRLDKSDSVNEQITHDASQSIGAKKLFQTLEGY